MKLSSLMLFWMLLLLVHDHVLQQPNGSCFACVEEERIALLDIKSSFSDLEGKAKPYSIFESWNKSSIDCCSWDGVHCSLTTKHVRTLDLYYSYGYTLNISLFLPFRELRSLILSENNFSSCIPSDCFGRLAKLDNLEYLDLSQNNFDSKALSSLAALGSLKTLSLSGIWAEIEFSINGSLNVHKKSQMANELFINGLSRALSKLSKLEYLDLSQNYLNGSIIPYLGGISSLKTLDLSNNNMNEGLDLNACQVWSNMSRLENLYLYDNSLNERIIPCLNKASSLKYLDLSYNNMGGNFSLKACQETWSNMSRLENLYLSDNSLNESIIPCLNKASSLKYLDLSYNNMGENFSLKACQAWSNMSRLENLNLYDNSLNERIIPCLNKASSLKYLDLAYNDMAGNFSLKEFSKINNLVELALSGVGFTGVSPLILEWTSLKRLYISGNEFNGTSLEGLCKIKNLEELDISNNNLNGNIPECLGHLSLLEYIDISYNQFGTLFPSTIIKNLTMLKYAFFSDNNFEGILSIDLFSNKSDLKELDLSNNYQLEIQTEHLGIVPQFQLNKLFLSNCILGFIPTFLSNQHAIEYIDLSSANLKGNIPQWLFKNNTNLEGLNLKNNSLNGPLVFPSNNTNLFVFDVSNNHVTGEIPNNIGYNIPNIVYLDMSDNLLQGVIPSSFGSLNNLNFVDLSYNTLSGVLPNCIGNLSHLRILNLAENKLEGDLTSEFCHLSNIKYSHLSKYIFSGLVPSCINMSSLKYLNLNGNHLTGPFPSALLGSSLAALDIGNNNFIGNISGKIWTSLKNLKIVILKGNHFEGELSEEICKLKYLRILDLSQNKLNGKIPSCLHYMGSDESLTLQAYLKMFFLPSETREMHPDSHGEIIEIEYIKFSTKGRSDTYKGRILDYLSGLDLSGNQFDGMIPEKMGDMTWLQALNFSNNRLSGPIPTTLSRLIDIESLDLSHNMLIGNIPSQLSELHFLEFFSVAYNNLSGPTLGLVSQFTTFDEKSYEGNPYLCGPPLVKNCTSMVLSPKPSQVTNDHDDEEEAMDRIIFFASLALGFITGFWGWMALLYFKRRWQYSFFLATDEYMKKALDMASNLGMKIKSLW